MVNNCHKNGQMDKIVNNCQKYKIKIIFLFKDWQAQAEKLLFWLQIVCKDIGKIFKMVNFLKSVKIFKIGQNWSKWKNWSNWKNWSKWSIGQNGQSVKMVKNCQKKMVKWTKLSIIAKNKNYISLKTGRHRRRSHYSGFKWSARTLVKIFKMVNFLKSVKFFKIGKDFRNW